MTADARPSWPWRPVAPDGDAVVHAGAASARAAAGVGWRVSVGAFAPVAIMTPLGAPEHVCVAAFRVAREGDGWTESMAVAPDRAALVGTFARRADAAADATWSVTVPGDVAIRFDAAGRMILVCDNAGLLLAVDRDVAWHVERTPDESRIAFTAPPPLRIVIAACNVDGTADRLVDAAVRDPALVGRMIDAGVRRRRAQGPVLELPGAVAIVDAFEWARVRLGWAGCDGTGDASAWHALGALAVGDVAGAHDRLMHLDADTSDALAVLAWARHLAWTGDTAALAHARTDLIARLGRITAPDMERDGLGAFADAAGRLRPSRAACVVAALREGVHLAESLADPALTALVSARARRASGAFARAFPSAREFGDDPDGALAAALGVSVNVGASADPSTDAWGALEAGHIRSGTDRLLAAAAALLNEVGEAGPAPVPAARYAHAIVSGLIGWAPDAVRDRVRLRPRLTDALLPASIRGLSAAGSAFDLEVVRDGPVHRLTVAQTAGAIPLNLVVEAWLPDGAFKRVSVDGREAVLDARPLDGGWVLPVQLTPDVARTLEVVGGA